MAGDSSTPFAKKLGLKPATRAALLHAPHGYAATLGDLPEGARISTRLAQGLDLIQLFVTREAELVKRLSACRDALPAAGVLWISWPKGKAKAAITTDLDDMIVRRHGLAAGLVDVKVCAVDDVWSGLKFVRRLRDR